MLFRSVMMEDLGADPGDVNGELPEQKWREPREGLEWVAALTRSRLPLALMGKGKSAWRGTFLLIACVVFGPPVLFLVLVIVCGVCLSLYEWLTGVRLREPAGLPVI